MSTMVLICAETGLPLWDETQPLPNISRRDMRGRLAVGELTADRMLEAYPKGVFPWMSASRHFPERKLWAATDPRYVLKREDFYTSRSLQKSMRKFEVRFDTAYAEVLKKCASVPRVDTIGNPCGTWIDKDFQKAYLELHQRGYAHSVETFYDGKLVGGLMGIAMGSIFFGDSMFHTKSDASKVALAHLAKKYENGIIDCQMGTRHIIRMGAQSMRLENFVKVVQVAIQEEDLWKSYQISP